MKVARLKGEVYWRYRMKKIIVEEAKKASLGMLIEVAIKLLTA